MLPVIAEIIAAKKKECEIPLCAKRFDFFINCNGSKMMSKSAKTDIIPAYKTILKLNLFRVKMLINIPIKK
jgi:hypothetical protein